MRAALERNLVFKVSVVSFVYFRVLGVCGEGGLRADRLSAEISNARIRGFSKRGLSAYGICMNGESVKTFQRCPHGHEGASVCGARVLGCSAGKFSRCLCLPTHPLYPF